MKCDWKYLSGCLFGFLLAACAPGETPTPQAAPGIAISVSTMELKNDNMRTRASFPLKPEKENLIRTLSLLVFDDEGQHYIEHSDYYRYLPVSNEKNPDGKLTVYEPGYAGLLTGNGTLCAVANMSREDLLEAMRKKAAEWGGTNVINLDDFKELSVDLPYIEHTDSIGLVKEIYMFGYYAGELKPYADNERHITISLGRLISRIDVDLSVNDEVDKAGLSYAIRLGNIASKAYIFPNEHSPEDMISIPYFTPAELTPNPVSYSYYVGPHTAATESEASYIEIAYGKKLKEDSTLDTGDSENKTVRIALCNDPPGTENRNYQLNRNSIYQISIRLVKKGDNTENANTRRLTDSGTYQVELDIQ